MNRLRILRAAAALLAVMVLFPASAARGAEFSLSSSSFHRSLLLWIDYEAAPGETNRVSTTLAPAGDRATLSDPGAVILPRLFDPGTPFPRTDVVHCVPLVTSVTCHTIVYQVEGTYDAQFAFVNLDLGDGNDVAESFGGRAWGGPGDDTITGTLGGVRMIGGPGADDLRGGPGGDDSADYSLQYPGHGGQGVSVSLDGVADDGLAGEGDNVGAAVENVYGTDGDDRIVGNPADNLFDGRAGDDELIGGDGDDWLVGVEGADVLVGGAGDDSFNPNIGFDNPDGAIDTVDCGPGDDLVRGPEPHDILIDCERIVGV